MDPLLSAAIGAPLIALLAYRLRALTLSGAVAAAAVGFAHLAFGGWLGASALLAFFATSTVLSRWGKRRKDQLGFEKGGQRDAGQVLANGGVAALCALLGQPVALLGALACANADTWATELGSLLGGTPRRITDFKPAAVGESGAISLLGTLASVAGAALLAGVGLAFGVTGRGALAVVAGGVVGALLDSLLGATLQAQFRDPATGKRTEQPTGEHLQGLPWLRNDGVNLLATLAGAVLARLVAG